MRSSRVLAIVGILASALVPGTAPSAAETAEIIVIRGESGCPGIPGLDVRLNGEAPAKLGAGEFIRLTVAAGEHHLVFYPAIPENIALVTAARGQNAYLVTSFRLGWRCKFGVEPIEGDALTRQLVTAREVPLSLARLVDRPLADDRGQLILKQP